MQRVVSAHVPVLSTICTGWCKGEISNRWCSRQRLPSSWRKSMQGVITVPVLSTIYTIQRSYKCGVQQVMKWAMHREEALPAAGGSPCRAS